MIEEFGKNEKKIREYFKLDDVYKNFRGNQTVFLTNGQIYEIFERLWNENYSKLKSEDNPRLFIVGAQPGAGKTGLVNKIGEDSKVLSLIGDIYRTLHPNIKIIVNNPDYCTLTYPLNRVINLLVISRCLDRRISFAFETTMRDLQSVERKLEMAYNSGYSIHFNILVVKKDSSFIGSYYRAAMAIKDNEGTRFNTPDFHDEAYNGVFDFFSHTESILKLNSLKLFNRNLELIFETDTLPSNIYTACLMARRVITAERTRSYIEKEAEELERQKTLVLYYIDKGLITVISKEDFSRECESRKEVKIKKL